MSPDPQHASWPAFKEWAAIVSALGAGAQSLILRKGGIAEGKGGFDPDRATRFWLYPTSFHAQLDKLKPAAAAFFDPLAQHASPVALDTYAEIISHRFVTDWDAVAALDSRHLWTEATVRERFDWSRPAGLHVLEVRVFRLAHPAPLPAGSDISGCKSWIDLPLGDPKQHSACPVTARA
ncbi:MAG: DUF1802 family protein [Opitutaceae bacterium]|nr:DUF1802 family protein [Opitutaceae bacterium]